MSQMMYLQDAQVFRSLGVGVGDVPVCTCVYGGK